MNVFYEKRKQLIRYNKKFIDKKKLRRLSLFLITLMIAYDPESIVNQLSINCQSIVNQLSINCQPIVHQLSTNFQPIVNQLLMNCQPIISLEANLNIEPCLHIFILFNVLSRTWSRVELRCLKKSQKLKI